MPIVPHIRRAWAAPGAFIADRLAEGLREDRALAVLMGACALSFVAQWPGLARAAHLDPTVPLDARLAGALFGTIFLLPPLAYGLAGLSHLVARAAGGQGTWYGARLALFWALLAVSPLMLLVGLLAGFLGPVPGTSIIGLIVFAGFLYLWGGMLWRAERGAGAWT